MSKKDYEWVSSIESFFCKDNEVWLDCKVVDEKSGELKNKSICFTTFALLQSGVTDTEYLKKQLKKFIDRM